MLTYHPIIILVDAWILHSHSQGGGCHSGQVLYTTHPPSTGPSLRSTTFRSLQLSEVKVRNYKTVSRLPCSPGFPYWTAGTSSAYENYHGEDGMKRREGEKIWECSQGSAKNSFIFHRKSSDDSWVSNGTYLELRKDLGFSKLDHPVLW